MNLAVAGAGRLFVFALQLYGLAFTNNLLLIEGLLRSLRAFRKSRPMLETKPLGVKTVRDENAGIIGAMVRERPGSV